MNVEIIWQGTNITTHVIEYTRQHDICTGIGSLDLIVEGNTEYDFIPWNSIVIKEEGNQVAKYNITSWERVSPGGNYIIAAQDNSKRLTDYFLDTEYTAETLSNTRYWIELILSESGVVDYDINTDSDGEPVTIGSQFGMKPAYDAILNLLQLSGWYMYFDASGSCQIGELDTNKTPVHDFYGTDILSIRTTSSDKMLRNRVYVWGSYDETDGWVYAKAETHLPWFRDDGEDWRSTVYQNSSIYYFSTALTMAEKILSEFSKQIPEKEVQIVGLHPNLQVGKYVRILGRFGTGVGQITSFIVNVNSEGAITTLIIDRRCPRLFGISDIKSQFIYIGTTEDGVYRKELDAGYWYPYNTNIETQHIRDLTAYDELLSTVTNNGNLFINKTGSWFEYTMPTEIVDINPTTLGQIINTSSGYFIATSMDTTYEPIGGITAVFSTYGTSGFSFENPLPIYPTSGNRSWVVGLTPDGVSRYMHQIHYDERIGEYGGTPIIASSYDLGVLDLSTNDLGKNVISVTTSMTKKWRYTNYGKYSNFGSNPIKGKDIYISLPPPTDGIYIIPEDWGGQTYTQTTPTPGYIYESPAGCDGSITKVYSAYGGDYLGITRDYLPSGATWSSRDIDALIDITGYDNLKYTPQHIKRLYKVDDNTYTIAYVEAYTDIGDTYEWYEFKLSEGKITNYKKFPSLYLGTHGLEVPNGGNASDNYYGGSDGKFVLEAHAEHMQWGEETGYKYYSGQGFVRVINIETGNIHNTVYLDISDYAPKIYGGGEGAWHLEIIGGYETPNHVIVAFIQCISGETTNLEQLPYYYIFTYVLNKYTGVLNSSRWEGTWKVLEYDNDDWSTEHVSGMNWVAEIGVEINERRNPFVACLREDPEHGFGSALIHVQHKITGRFWGWGWSFIPFPGYYWGSQHKGNYWESRLLTIDLQSAAIIGNECYMLIDEGNPDTLPPISETYLDECPIWLRKGYNNNITATYSRNLLPPIIFESMRLDPWDEGDWKTAFMSPYSKNVFFYLDNPELYKNGADNKRYPMDELVFHPMVDDLDNTIYFTTASGQDDIYGLDIYGNMEKRYRGGFGAGEGDWNNASPIPIGNKVILDNSTVRGLINWPGASGVDNRINKYSILYHDPAVLPSGQFNVLFDYKYGLAVETGMGLPTIIYDPPLATTGWLHHTSCSILGASWTNSGIFPTMDPDTAITDGRLLDIFQGVNFPLAPGYSLPNNTISRFLGTVDSSNNTIKIFNTEYETNEDRYSVIHFFDITYDVTHIDFTNFFPSPYIFVSPINPTSGQQFFQRFTEDGIFYNLSYNLPEGSLITIIRADDRI